VYIVNHLERTNWSVLARGAKEWRTGQRWTYPVPISAYTVRSPAHRDNFPSSSSSTWLLHKPPSSSIQHKAITILIASIQSSKYFIPWSATTPDIGRPCFCAFFPTSPRSDFRLFKPFPYVHYLSSLALPLLPQKIPIGAPTPSCFRQLCLGPTSNPVEKT
jgi:hypothetical protein